MSADIEARLLRAAQRSVESRLDLLERIALGDKRAEAELRAEASARDALKVAVPARAAAAHARRIEAQAANKADAEKQRRSTEGENGNA